MYRLQVVSRLFGFAAMPAAALTLTLLLAGMQPLFAR
jgi:hypothetical protein